VGKHRRSGQALASEHGLSRNGPTIRAARAEHFSSTRIESPFSILVDGDIFGKVSDAR
jgi:hypothetical protein